MTVFQIVPPQALFFVFALLVCAAVPTPAAEALPRFGLAVVTAVFAWLLTMSGWAIRRIPGVSTGPLRRWGLVNELRRRPRLDLAALRDPRVWLTVAQNVVGVLIAGGVALAFGFGHAYWAVVSLVAVIPRRVRRTPSRGLCTASWGPSWAWPSRRLCWHGPRPPSW
ncbi:hypothetical protein [Leifsonia xyli]|uniref:hypothetical protein n=1 Tax=Leifsonia xyli TaxID=1575 RepID=UPI003D67BC78